jgi:hypothetical protein
MVVVGIPQPIMKKRRSCRPDKAQYSIEDSCSLSYCALCSGRSLPTFQRFMLPTSSSGVFMMQAENSSETSVNDPEDSGLQKL